MVPIRVLVLGTAAGGGAPQWNCACIECGRARQAGEPAWRSQDALAVGDAQGGWHLFNASPDIRAQILRAAELAPGPGRRQSPIRSVLLTDAELDHALGLVSLRESACLDLYATAPVLGALGSAFPVRQLLAPYSGSRWRAVVPGEPTRLAAGLAVTATALGGKRPRYAADQPAQPDWVVGYRIEDQRSGGVIVYAPCLGRWSPEFEKVCDGAQCVILDGTFYRDDEMTAATGGGSTALAMGHLPVGGEEGSLSRLRVLSGARRIYTHLNNTNPMLDPHSPQRAEVRNAGAEVAEDGLSFVL